MSSACDAAVLASLAQLLAGSPDEAGDLLGVLVDDTLARLDKIDAALAAGHRGEVRQLAHAARGAVGAVGARQLETIFAHLEESAADAALDALGGHLDQARREFGRARIELDDWVRGLRRE